VNNVFAFAPDGKIIFACINYPGMIIEMIYLILPPVYLLAGSWHDTAVCHELINVCLTKLGDYCLCVDQGFPRSGSLYGKFAGPISRKAKKRLSPIVRQHIIVQCDVYTSLRQASEWGMRGLQGTFCRLKSRLPSNIILSVTTFVPIMSE